MALQRGYDAYQHFGPAQVGRWMGRWLTGFLLAGAVAGVSIRSLRRWREFNLQTFKHGLQFQSEEGRSTIRWDEISAVYASAVRYGLPGLIWGKHTYLALDTHHNTRIDIAPSLEGIEDLAEIIKQHVYPLLLERYKQQQKQGHSLQFGGILLTPNGITTPRGNLSWSELTQVTLHNGLITLESNPSNGGGRLRLSTRDVPNVELLIQYIRRMGKLA
ncbi:MAG: hypothetical protein PVG63_08240 [Anaerolineales bacterium]|jgi:hypothetical protein